MTRVPPPSGTAEVISGIVLEVVPELVSGAVGVAEVVGVLAAGRAAVAQIDGQPDAVGADAADAVVEDPVAPDRVHLREIGHEDADPAVEGDDVAFTRADAADHLVVVLRKMPMMRLPKFFVAVVSVPMKFP